MNIVDRIISPNIWDEVWEVGIISGETGANVASTTRLRSKNYIECLSETTYFANIYPIYIRFYNANKNFISKNDITTSGQTFTTSVNCKYMRFCLADSYGTTYKHDICINESNPSINGKYFPYVMYKRYDMVDLIHTHNLWNKTVKYNQLAKSINASNWYASAGTTTYDNGVGTFIANVQTASAYTRVTLTENHKYLILATIKLTTGTNQIVFRHQNNSLYSSVASINTTEWQTLRKIFTATNNASQILQILDNRSSGRDAFKFKDVCCIDLTEWFKNDIPQALLNDPSTFDEYWDGELTYNAGTDVLPNNSIKRLKIGG